MPFEPEIPLWGTNLIEIKARCLVKHCYSDKKTGKKVNA